MNPVRLSLRDPMRRAMPVGEWPAADVAAWRRALDAGDILEAGGAARGWSTSTVRKHANGYGRWLSFLARTGQLHALSSPVDRVTPEAVAAYVRELAALNVPRTVIGRLEELRDVLRVMEPGRDWVVDRPHRCPLRPP